MAVTGQHMRKFTAAGDTLSNVRGFVYVAKWVAPGASAGMTCKIVDRLTGDAIFDSVADGAQFQDALRYPDRHAMPFYELSVALLATGSLYVYTG